MRSAARPSVMALSPAPHWARAAALFRLGGFLAILLVVAPGCRWLCGGRCDTTLRTQSLVEEALAASERGDVATAERLCERAAELSPENIHVRQELARLLLQRGAAEEARVHLEYLLTHHPDDVGGCVQLAALLHEQGRYRDAEQLLDSAISHDPLCTRAWLLKGQVDEAYGLPEQALASYHRALVCDATQTEAMQRIAALHLARGEPQLAAALLRSVNERSIATPEQRRQMEWLLGTAYAQQQRWPEAVAHLHQGLPAQEPTARQCYELAYACRQVGDEQSSREMLTLALQRDPTHAPSQAMYAQMLPPEGVRTTIVPVSRTEVRDW